jgi:hypothetical protein
MQIQRCGKMNEVFADQLTKLSAKQKGILPVSETRLEGDRKDKKEEPLKATTEVGLDGERKGPQESLPEKQLDKVREAAAVPLVEKRLDDAPKTGLYPHRNEKAWLRTEQKRPINALDEEIGKMGDQSKLDRYKKAEEASLSQKPDRVVDKGIGQQMVGDPTKIKAAESKADVKKSDVPAFNLKQSSKKFAAYLQYKGGKQVVDAAALDSLMGDILSQAQEEKRKLTEDEMAKVAAMKLRKSEILGIRG